MLIKKDFKWTVAIFSIAVFVFGFQISVYGMSSGSTPSKLHNMDIEIAAHQATAMVSQQVPGALEPVSGEVASETVEQVIADSVSRYKLYSEVFDSLDSDEWLIDSPLVPIKGIKHLPYQVLASCTIGAGNVLVLVGASSLVTAAGAKNLLLASTELFYAPFSAARIASLGLMDLTLGSVGWLTTCLYGVPIFVISSLHVYANAEKPGRDS